MSGFKDKKVLVTGAEGFIGSHLCSRLVDEGARVTALVFPGADRARLQSLDKNIAVRPVDIRDEGGMAELISNLRPERIFHLAALTDVRRSWENLDEIIGVNLGGTVNLVRALNNVDYEILVAADTAEAYGRNPAPFREEMALDPVSPYSFSKASATAFCRMAARSFQASIRVLRLFLVYGPGQSLRRFLPQLINAALSGERFRMTAGEQSREYTYIADAVEGFLSAGSAGPGRGEVYNLCSGEEITLNRLVEAVEAGTGRKVNRDPEPLPYRSGEISRFVGDNSLIERDLKWRPTVDLRDGLSRTIDWYRGIKEEG